MAITDIITAGNVASALAMIVGALIATWLWLRPVKVVPGAHLVLDGSGPDSITADIVNKSAKTIYVVRCIARGTYPWRSVVWRHLRQPLMPLRLYPVARFSPITHDLMPAEPVKIEPKQPITLRHRLSDHPLAKMHSSWFLIEITLSNGRTFRSKLQRAPERWRLKRAA
jgi:hypothetical protein